MAVKHPWPSRSKKQRLCATFVEEDDGRYAEINGITYPVLLSSCRSGPRYEEDMADDEDYPLAWRDQFRRDLDGRAAAVLVGDESDGCTWTFLGLFQVHDIQLSNLLWCRLGAKLAKLKLL